MRGAWRQLLDSGKQMGKSHRVQKEESGRFHGEGQGIPRPEAPFTHSTVSRAPSALPTQLHAGAAGVKRCGLLSG